MINRHERQPPLFRNRRPFRCTWGEPEGDSDSRTGQVSLCTLGNHNTRNVWHSCYIEISRYRCTIERNFGAVAITRRRDAREFSQLPLAPLPRIRDSYSRAFSVILQSLRVGPGRFAPRSAHNIKTLRGKCVPGTPRKRYVISLNDRFITSKAPCLRSNFRETSGSVCDARVESRLACPVSKLNWG